MTTEDYLVLHANIPLRQHIIDTAKGLSRDKRIQADLVGHAWFILGEAKAQKTDEYYRRYAMLRMQKRYLLIVYKEVFIT